jgi:hypothetical protein
MRVRVQHATQSWFAMVVVFTGLASGCGGGSSQSGGGTPIVGAVSVAVSPATVSVQAGRTQVFTATVLNDSGTQGVTWALAGSGCSGATCGTLSAANSASGAALTYTAPASVPNPALVTLTATSVTDGTKTAAAAITVTATAPAAGVSVSVSPASWTILVGETRPFTPTVKNDSTNKGVNWTLSGAGCTGATCGTISASASASGTAITYTAPTALPSPASVTLTATSVADGTKSAAVTITVGVSAGPVSVTLTPKAGGLVLGQALNLSATVTNDVDAAGVTWTASVGTFSAQAATTATYVAPASPGSGITITATSVIDSTQTATATIGVTDLSGVTTYHNDLSRDGANVQEYALNTTNVAPATFGKLFSCTVDGAVYAQPLWVPNVSVASGTHNVILAATTHDSVYLFDADASPCVTYWNFQLVPAGETYGNYADANSEDIFPDIGIIGTPVIDPSSSIIYLVTKTKTAGGTYHQRLHALSLATGAEAPNSPVEISSAITVPGTCEGGTTISFNTLTQNQRPALALVNGIVYVGWGSHSDQGTYHGWLVGYQTANLTAAPVAFNDTPNALSTAEPAPSVTCGAGIWMSGGAPAADANNNLFLITGNGDFDGVTDFGDSYLKLSTPALSVLDSFTPSDQGLLDSEDADVGSSGTAVLIDETSGPNPHLLVGGSKASMFFLLDRDDMGKFNPTDAVVQEWQVNGPSFCTPGFWNNNLYFFGVNFTGTQVGESFAFDPVARTFNSSATNTTTAAFGFAGATPSMSASSATTDGIVWAIDTGAYGTSGYGTATGGPAILHAFDASNISTELWNSSQAAGGRDTAGNAVKFTVPTIANGKVYIGTRGSDNTVGGGTTFGELDVYGLLPN